MEDLLPIVGASLGSGTACWAVMRVEIRFLWRDMREVKRELKVLKEERIKWLLERRQTAR